MKIKSLQQIEDFYKNQGYTGDKLRKILEKDGEWKELVKERKNKLSKKISLRKAESTKYVMSTDADFEILSKIKQLEKLNLAKEERFIVGFIRSQLKHDWRKPILKELNNILRKYSKE